MKMKEETKLKISIANKGKNTWSKNRYVENKSIFWKGDNIGYRAKHLWVIKWKGKPKKCENCGTEDARKYEWANIDHSYRRILDDYIRMCTSCHRKYDMEHNNYQSGLNKII